jgi:hypothetical protein
LQRYFQEPASLDENAFSPGPPQTIISRGKSALLNMTFVPPVVSRRYRFDWQYAVDVSRIPVLSTATTVIAVMPLLLSTKAFISLLGGSIPLALLLLWPASLSFVLAWVLLYLRCPKFIREYRDLGQYKERQHSHRWIVWEFHNNLESLAGWENIVRETFSKGITCELKEIQDPEASAEALKQFTARTAVDSVKVFTPINVKRDIYLPILCDGKQWVLSLREDDQKIEAKEKELFWILYSQAAKERPVSRTIFWILVCIAAALVATNVLKNIVLAVIYLCR